MSNRFAIEKEEHENDLLSMISLIMQAIAEERVRITDSDDHRFTKRSTICPFPSESPPALEFIPVITEGLSNKVVAMESFSSSFSLNPFQNSKS
jgi:hypothetical protein